jgi:hypothetical protein
MLNGASMSFGKFWESAHHMIETVIWRLPSLLLAIIVFVLFYGLSVFVSRIIRRSTRGRRENLGMVFGRLFGWAGRPACSLDWNSGENPLQQYRRLIGEAVSQMLPEFFTGTTLNKNARHLELFKVSELGYVHTLPSHPLQ